MAQSKQSNHAPKWGEINDLELEEGDEWCGVPYGKGRVLPRPSKQQLEELWDGEDEPWLESVVLVDGEDDLNQLVILEDSILFSLIKEAFPTMKLPLKLHELKKQLNSCGADLIKTKFEDTYLIRFGNETNRQFPNLFRLKGLIFNGVDSEIYAPTFPVPIEFNHLSPSEQDDIIAQYQTTQIPYLVQEATDGVMIRLWFHPVIQEWVISTNGSVDAFDVSWSQRTIGDLFREVFEYLKTLNLEENQVYFFIMCHPENSFVIAHPCIHIEMVTTIDLNTLLEIDRFDLMGDLVYQLPSSQHTSFPIYLKTLHTYSGLTIDHVLGAIQKCSRRRPIQLVGFVLTPAPDSHGLVRRVRIENADFIEARNLLGSHDHLDKVSWDLYLHASLDQQEAFVQYFPFYLKTYLNAIILLNRYIKFLQEIYRQRYQDKKVVRTQPGTHAILKDLHMTYQSQVPNYSEINERLQQETIDNLFTIIHMGDEGYAPFPHAPFSPCPLYHFPPK